MVGCRSLSAGARLNDSALGPALVQVHSPRRNRRRSCNATFPESLMRKENQP